MAIHGGNMKNLVVTGLLILGFSAPAANVNASPRTQMDQNKLRDFTYHYSLSQRAIDTLLGHVATRDSDLDMVLDILRDCHLTQVDDGATVTHRIAAEKGCDIEYTSKTTTSDKGLNDNGDPITETDTESSLTVKTESLASIMGFRSWTSHTQTHAETLASSPVYSEITVATSHFVTDYAETVSLSTNTRHYENLETDEQPYFRNATIQFKDFSSQFEVKATVRSGVVFKTVARQDGVEVTLSDLVKTYTAELVGLD